MTPEQVPDELVHVAYAHYSMHGHGLVRTILAAVLPVHEHRIREQIAKDVEAAERALAETDPATAESSHRIAARCGGLLEAAQIARGGAPTVWSDAIPPGGRVCAAPMPDLPDGICGMPVESEPCPDHGGGS